MVNNVNTKLEYLYRDASNYKEFKEVVIKGSLHKADLAPYLHEAEFFVPSEVGLPDLQHGKWSEDDHIWHEIESLTVVDEEHTLNISAVSLLHAFKQASAKAWNEIFVYKRKGLL